MTKGRGAVSTPFPPTTGFEITWLAKSSCRGSSSALSSLHRPRPIRASCSRGASRGQRPQKGATMRDRATAARGNIPHRSDPTATLPDRGTRRCAFTPIRKPGACPRCWRTLSNGMRAARSDPCPRAKGDANRATLSTRQQPEKIRAARMVPSWGY